MLACNSRKGGPIPPIRWGFSRAVSSITDEMIAPAALWLETELMRVTKSPKTQPRRTHPAAKANPIPNKMS